MIKALKQIFSVISTTGLFKNIENSIPQIFVVL